MFSLFQYYSIQIGLIVIAAGTSVPDALASVIVAKEGEGDMAVANALGSNIFDINLGLGLPFLIKYLITGERFDLLKSNKSDRQNLESGTMPMTPHSKFGFILLGVLVLFLLAFYLNS